MCLDELTGDKLRRLILEKKLEKIKNFRKTMYMDTKLWALKYWMDVEFALEKKLEEAYIVIALLQAELAQKK